LQRKGDTYDEDPEKFLQEKIFWILGHLNAKVSLGRLFPGLHK